MTTTFHSTRSTTDSLTAKQAIRKGIADDGGLFVSDALGKTKVDVASLPGKSYQQIAAEVLGALLPDFTAEELGQCIADAYGEQWSDERITPLKPLGDDYVLELFNGPTSAFKDVALQILPRFMAHTTPADGDADEKIMILTATSGDTGKAALAGFADAQKTKAADSNKNGFLIRGGSADNILSDFLPHLVVHGGWVVDENNNPTVDTPEFKAAMQEYLDLYALGSTLDKDDIVASVTSGETALAQIWPGWYTPTADGPANYTTIPTKLTDDSAPVDAVALQGVWCIGIPDNAPHKDLALELLEYVMSPEVQLASIENNGVPCRYSCLTDSTVLETYPHLQTVCGALETGVYRPVIEEWTEFTNILGTEMDNIIQGTKTMDEALAYAQEQLEQLMA